MNRTSVRCRTAALARRARRVGLSTRVGTVGLLALVPLALPGAAHAALQWSAPIAIDRALDHPLQSVSCPSTNQCTALDGAGQIVTFNPTSAGTPRSATIDDVATTAVACPSTSQCTAVDHWGREITFDPAAPGRPTPVYVNQHFEGRLHDPDDFALDAIACPSTSRCVAIDSHDQQNAAVFDPTAPGTPTFITLGGLFNPTAIACPSSNQCTVVDSGMGLERTFDPDSPGTSSEVRIDSSNGGLRSIACPSVTLCVAVEESGSEVTFDPTLPGSPTPVTVDDAPDATLQSVACASTSQCTAVDDAGREMTFDPASPATASVAVVSSSTDGLGVSCPSPRQCTVVGSHGQAATFDPISPSTHSSITLIRSTAIAGVACPSSDQCTAVDVIGREVTFNPQSPGTTNAVPIAPAHRSGGTRLREVVCPSTTQCTAIAASGEAFTFDPARPPSPAQAGIDLHVGGAGAIACPTVSQCTASGGNGGEVTLDLVQGGQLLTTYRIDTGSDSPSSSIACPSTSQCTVVDGDERTVTFNPAVTHNPAIPGPSTSTMLALPPAPGTTIDCPSTSQCTAIDIFGDSVTFTPNAPAGSAAVQLPIGGELSDAECPSVTLCVAVDTAGDALEGNPTVAGSWTTNPIAGAVNFTSISCSSTTQCVAVDDSGFARVGTAVAVAAATPPVNGSSPTISGTATVGHALSASTGAWSGSSPISYAYQWQRCSSLCADIAGATSAAYTLTGADRKSRIQIVVTATNAGGMARGASNPIGPVAAAFPGAAAIRALLLRQLIPHGKAFTIASVLARGYVFSFTPPLPGRLVISWYLVRKGGGRVLIAIRRKTVVSTRKARFTIGLTAAGRRRLRHRNHITLVNRASFTPTGHASIRVSKTLALRRP
jgi:hypothetical protein